MLSLGDRYEVSSLGRIRSLKPKNGREAPYVMRIQRGGPHGRKGSESPGRPQISLWDGKKIKTYRLAVLVARAFLGEPPSGLEICHNDGDDWNCVVTNMRYDTHSANIIDSIQHGTHRSIRKDTCRFGHPLDGIRKNGGKTSRYCLTCNRNRAAASRMLV